jgi:hypothetical protein
VAGDYKIFRRFGLFIFIMFTLLLNSCITDEFKLGELKIKDSFKTDLIAPLFAGNLEFRDFIAWDESGNSGINDSTVILEFPNGTTKKIYTQIIFDQTILVDSFPFSIQGNYELVTITMVFRVNNGTPFPLNLSLRYFNKAKPLQLGPPIQPPTFDEGETNKTDVVPVQTIHQIFLNEEQRLSFLNGNRIQFKTWFDKTGFINENDTLYANYPVDISVVLIGEVKAGDEDN